jgi:hypothetical protein
MLALVAAFSFAATVPVAHAQDNGSGPKTECVAGDTKTVTEEVRTNIRTRSGRTIPLVIRIIRHYKCGNDGKWQPA